MSEPWCPEPPVDTTPFGPAAEPWTLTFDNGSFLRKVVVIANSTYDAQAQGIGFERKPGETLILVEQGGQLPAVRR